MVYYSWKHGWHGWCANIGGMLLLLLLFLLKYYPEDKVFECLLLKQNSSK